MKIQLSKIKNILKDKSVTIYYPFILIGFVTLIITLSITPLAIFFNAEKIDVFKVIIQLFGGILIFYGLLLNKRRTESLEDQVKLAEDSNITDRFQKAIEQIGSDNISIRQGGIHSLGRLGLDSIKRKTDDWRLVLDVFVSFIQKDITNNNNISRLNQIDYITVINYLFANEFAEYRINNNINISFNGAIIPFSQENSPVIKNTILNDCKFSTLKSAHFEACSFYGLILVNNNFDENITSNCFEFLQFKESFFGNLQIQNAIIKNSVFFEKCKFSGLEIFNTKVPHFTNCNFDLINFHSCNFENASFTNCSAKLLIFNDQTEINIYSILEFKEIKKITGLKYLYSEDLKKRWPDINLD